MLLLLEHDCRYFVLLLLVRIFKFLLFVFVLIVILFWLLLLLLSTWYNPTMNGIDNRYASMLLSDVSWYLLFFVVQRIQLLSLVVIAVSETIVDIFVLLFQFVIRVFTISDEVVCTVDGIKCCWCYFIYFVTGNVSYYCCFRCKRGSCCC